VWAVSAAVAAELEGSRFPALELRPEEADEVAGLPEAVARAERLLLGLRLDEPLPLAPIAAAVDRGALGRLERLGLVRKLGADGDDDAAVTLTRRGRLLGGGVTADLLA
jgi:hypothetical protein